MLIENTEEESKEVNKRVRNLIGQVSFDNDYYISEQNIWQKREKFVIVYQCYISRISLYLKKHSRFNVFISDSIFMKYHLKIPHYSLDVKNKEYLEIMNKM